MLVLKSQKTILLYGPFKEVSVACMYCTNLYPALYGKPAIWLKWRGRRLRSRKEKSFQKYTLKKIFS